MVKAVERAHEIGAGRSRSSSIIRRRGGAATSHRARARPSGRADRAGHRAGRRPRAYLVNLAGPDEDFFGSSVGVLASDLRAAPGFAGRYVNVHVGSHRGTGVAAGTERWPMASPLSWRKSRGAGCRDGRPRELARQRVRDRDGRHRPGRDRRGGRCPRHPPGGSGSVSTRRTPGGGDRSVGPGRDRRVPLGLRCADRSRPTSTVHLNDSKSELGSHLDRHEHLGAGRIGTRGLGHLLLHPALAHVVYYIETPGMDEGYDAINIARGYDTPRGAHGGPAARGDDVAWEPGPTDRRRPSRLKSSNVSSRLRRAAGIANAGAPDAGVRCPETRIVEGESGPCPGVMLVAAGLPVREPRRPSGRCPTADPDGAARRARICRSGSRRPRQRPVRRHAWAEDVTASVGLEGSAVAAHPHGEVVLHDLADLRLAQELVGAQRVLDARGRVRVAGRDEAEVLRRVGVVAQLAQAASELRGGARATASDRRGSAARSSSDRRPTAGRAGAATSSWP